MQPRNPEIRGIEMGGGPPAPSGESGLPEIGVAPEKHKIPSELEQYRQEAEAFLDTYRELFYAIAMDRSLEFRVGNGFYINLKEGLITFDIRDWKWKRELGLSDWQLVWSVCHELSHFWDLKEEPKEMLANFERMEERAHELAPRVLEIWKSKFPGGQLPEYLTREVKVDRKGTKKPFAEVFLFRKLHLLYNSLDDRYVNQPLGLRSQVFGPGGSQEGEVERLYRDYLFPTDPKARGKPPEAKQAADYASLPKSYQLAYYFLRKRMVPDQEILVSPEVRAVIDGYADQVAREAGVTFADEVAAMTDPAKKRVQSCGYRYKKIREGVEPVFLDFLWKDLEEQDPPPPPQKGEGEGEGEGEPGEPTPGESEGEPQKADPWQELDPKSEPIDKATVEDFLKQQADKGKEDKREARRERKKQELSPDQRAAEARKEIDRAIAKKHDVDPRFAQEYRRIEKSIEPYKAELAAVFEQIMRTITERLIRFWEEGFRSGKFDVGRFIRKFSPEIAAEAPELIPWDQLEVYLRREFEKRLSLFPHKIRVRLVLDGSGSMNTERILALKQLSVLFLEALTTFQETINLRFKLKEPISVDTEIRMFGDAGASKVVKKFAGAKQDNPEAELADRFQAFGLINSGYGGTCDAEPHWKIAADISPKDEEELKSGRAREFVFEITDGGSNGVSQEGAALVHGSKTPAAQDTRNAREALTKKGVIARGFQVETEDPGDIATFESIWGDHGEKVPHPKDLASAVGRVLADELQKIDFEIQYYPVEEEDE